MKYFGYGRPDLSSVLVYLEPGIWKLLFPAAQMGFPRKEGHSAGEINCHPSSCPVSYIPLSVWQQQ